MAENTTDETVDYNSEGNSQGPTNPKDRRTGYSSVSELLRANYLNTLKKGATSVKPLFEAAKAGVLPVQKEQAKTAQKVKPAFSMEDVESAAMAENKPKSESVSKSANIITKPQIFTEKPVKPTLIRKEKKVPTLEEFQQQAAKEIYKFRSESEPIVKVASQPEKDNSDIEIAVENTMRLFDSQLNKDAPNRDFTISNIKNNIYNGLNNGDLRIVNDKDGYPVIKNVIDGVLSNVIEGYRQTAIQDKEHDTYFSLSKEQQIARLKGYNLKAIETVGEVGKLYPEKYRQSPLDPYQGAIETQKTGFAPDVAAGIGQVGYDVRYSAARAIPVAGNVLSEIMSSVSYGKRQLMDGIAKSFNTAVQSGLSDDEAWEIANSPYNKILNAATGAVEGYTSQAVNKNIFKSFAKPASTKALRTFGQAMSTFVKDAAANSKEAIGSAAIDAATAWSMEKIRGGSDEAANEQGKMEFLVNMALVGLGAGFKAPKYIKSYAYNAISNVDPQDIYTKGVQLEQQGFMPEGTSKKIVENVEKFKKIKEGLVNVKEENIPSVAGLLMKKDSLLEMQKTADSSNTALQDSINNELNIVNEKITTAINSKNPLSVEYDDKTGINLKYNENAITANEQKQQESTTASNISEYQRTEGIQTQTPYETNNSYSDFGSKKEKVKFPGTVYLDASNASNYSITDAITPRDFMINSANKVISSLSSINPGLKVIVFDNATEYGTALVERELGPGTVNNQRAAELRGSNGAYDKSNNTIYINGEQLNKNGKTTTLFHEGTHPIINAIASSSSVAVDNLYEQLNQLSATMADMQKTGEMPNGLEISDAIDEVVNWADRVYKSQSDATKKSEAIVEFIARVSDGTITLPQDSPVVMKSFIDVIKGFLDIIGMPVDIRSFSDIENIAAKIKEAFETGQRIEVSTVKNENGEITLYNDNIKVGEPGTVSASGVINPEMFNVDNLQTDLFQPAKVSWNEFESDGSFDMITPENAVKMYDALKKSGGALVVTNSDATGIGLSNKGNLRQGGIGFTFIQENLDTQIGFAASDDSKIPSFYKAIVDAKNKRDAAYPSEAGKPVAVFVMVQSPTAMFGNAYGADYFADSLEYVTRNKAISTKKAKAELVDFISNFVKANETGRKYESSFTELVDIIKRYDMSTDEGKNAIDQLLITNKESNRDTSNRFGFDARRYFFSNFFAGEGTVSSKAPASNLRNALKESGFYIKDFIDEYGDENVVNNLTGKNNTEKYMKDGGFAMTGFFVDPYMSQEEFVAKSKNQTFQHRQFNSGFHGVDPFILDGKYYVNEAFPEASFVSNKPGSEGKEIPVATSAAGSMYPRTQKNQQQVVERFALQQEGTGRKSFKKTQAEANRSQQDVEASFMYDSKKKERAQKTLKEKVKGNKLDRVTRVLIDNQALTRKSLRNAGDRGAIVEALLTTSRGYGAQASLVADDVNSIVYDGLSNKEDINIAGVMFSEVSLLDEIMNQKRMVSIQNMLKDNFDKLLKLKEQFDKTKSAKKKARIQDEITFVEDYLKDRNVLGTKYNPQTKKSEYYLQNYQVGSTVDANGKSIPNNAEMAKKKLAVIEQSYGKFKELSKRAKKMFDAYKAILGDKLENGLIDQETYDILSKYDYVPISYIEHILNDEVPGYSKVTPKNPNQMTKSVLSGGADGDVLTDFKSVLDIYLNNHYKSVFNNRAAIGLAKMAEDIPNNGIAELVQSVKDEDGNEILNPDGNPKYPSAPEGKGYIYYYDNGKRKALLTDLAIANEWYAQYEAGGFDVLGKATLAPFTQSLLTGKNAAFGVYQMMLLDPITVAISTDVFSKSVPIAYAQIASGWKNAVVQVSKAGSDYRKAALAGAFTQMNVGKELESSLKYEGALGRIGTKASEFVDKIGLGKVTDVTEKATRLIVFLKAEEVFTKQFVKENGRQPSLADMQDIRAKAAHEARRSADFARGGSFVKPLSKSFLYLNSTAQTGAAVLAQIKKNPARFVYQTSEFLVAGGAIQAISAGLIPLPWEDEEERKKKQEMYKALSDYTKLNYFNIYVGGNDPESAFVKIPLPPVIKNIWATGMMGMINTKMNGNFKANDFVSNGLAVNPFGDVESLISKAPPVVNALLAFSNYDLFKKDLIVDNEEAMPDYLEAYKDKNVPGLAKSTTKWLDKYGINLSPKRGYEAVNKIIGDPSRNPMLNIPKVAFNSALQFMTGAPIQVKTDFEKDWLKTTLEVAGLQKRLYSASYKYYESRTISEIAEIKNMKENLLIEQVAKGKNSKEYKALNEKIATAESKLTAFINKVKTEDKDSYSKIVEVNKKNQTVVSKSIMKKGELEYIKNVFGADYLELAKIPRTAEKAQRIYDMAERMDEQKAYEFLTNVVKLKIMTPEVARAYGEIGKQEE
jgi:hypothetical protein